MLIPKGIGDIPVQGLLAEESEDSSKAERFGDRRFDPLLCSLITHEQRYASKAGKSLVMLVKNLDKPDMEDVEGMAALANFARAEARSIFRQTYQMMLTTTVLAPGANPAEQE